MIMSSVNRESFTTSFLNYISSISSSCLMSLAKTSRFILYGIRSGVLVWLWILVEMLTAFPIQHDAGNLFHTLPRLCWGMFLLYQVCSSFFFFLSWRDVVEFIKCFLCINWDHHVVFSPQLVNVVYHIWWFVYVELSLHIWNDSQSRQMFFCILIQLASIFGGFLYLSGRTFVCSLLCDIFFWFWNSGDVGFVGGVWDGSLPFTVFWE